MLFGKQKVLHPVPEFCFCTGASEKSEIFTKYWYINFPRCPIFSKFLELQKYGLFTDFYRLFCFKQILFCLHSLLVLIMPWTISGGVSHGEVRIQYLLCKNEFESIYHSTSSMQYVSYTNGSHEVLLSFVWLKFSSFGCDHDGLRNKE